MVTTPRAGLKRQVAQFDLAGHRRRMAAAQHGTQACGQFAGIAGLGQVVVGTQLQTEDAVQRLTACREHEYRELRVIGTQLLEQLQPAAVWQHHVQYHRRRGGFGQRLAGTLAVMASLHLKAFLTQPTAQELTQLLVIINK
jgi:hypothetical protein